MSFDTPDVTNATATVAAQYEQWMYPEPIQDLEAYCADGKTDGTAVHENHWMYWPDGWYLDQAKEAIDILVAGCGANAAARYAYKHPKAQVVGIDLSSQSLAHEQFLKDKHGLANLTLHQMPIQEIASLGQSFDFIESCGVIHHLAQPEEGLHALKKVLRPHGVIALMLYGQYGRAGIYMLQDLFRRVGVGQTPEDVAFVRSVLQELSPEHLAVPMLKTAQDLQYDAGLVDLLLHPVDQAYTVKGCLDLLEATGFRFRGWVDPYHYYPEGQISEGHPLRELLANHPNEAEIWPLMELFHGRLTMHTFYARHADSPFSDAARVTLDANDPAFWQQVPIRRINRVHHPDWAAGKMPAIQRVPFPAVTMSIEESQVFNEIDGSNTVADVVEITSVSKEKVHQWLKLLYRMGYLVFKI